MTKDPLNSEQREIVNRAKRFCDSEEGFEEHLEKLFDLIDELFPEPKPPEPEKLYAVRLKENKQIVVCFTSIDKAEHFISKWATNDGVFEIASFVEEKV